MQPLGPQTLRLCMRLWVNMSKLSDASAIKVGATAVDALKLAGSQVWPPIIGLLDTFTRSGTLAGSTSDSGHLWVAGGISYSCNGSTTTTTGAGVGPTIDLGTPTVSVAADCVSGSGGVMPFVAGRVVDANNYYAAFVGFNADSAQIIQCIAGSWSFQTSYSWSAGQRLELDFADGGGSTTVTLKIAGVTVGTFVDSNGSRPNGTKVAFGSQNGGGVWDNLQAV